MLRTRRDLVSRWHYVRGTVAQGVEGIKVAGEQWRGSLAPLCRAIASSSPRLLSFVPIRGFARRPSGSPNSMKCLQPLRGVPCVRGHPFTDAGTFCGTSFQSGLQPIANIRGSAPTGRIILFSSGASILHTLSVELFLCLFLRAVNSPAGIHAVPDRSVAGTKIVSEEEGTTRERERGPFPIIFRRDFGLESRPLNRQPLTRKIVSFRENAEVTFAHE